MKKANDKLITPIRIKIEIQHDDHYSYCVDVNGLLKGEWGGYKELDKVGPNKEAMFELYYDRFCQWTVINEFGYFYNKFSCKKYDGVLELVKDHVFICEKNGCFGLIDGDGNTLLHVSYEDITPYLEDAFFIVTTEVGKFLFNLLSGLKSEVYDNIFTIRGHIIFNIEEKYGLMDKNGHVILPPKYKKPRWGSSHLLYEFQGFEFDVFVYNGLLYGKFPIVNKYDNLFRVGDDSDCFYVTEKDGKYGLLSELILKWDPVKGGVTRCISEPIFDEILLYKFKSEVSNCVLGTYFNNDQTGTYSKVFFVIVRLGEKYRLYNTKDGTCLLDDCDNISFEGAYKKGSSDKCVVIVM